MKLEKLDAGEQDQAATKASSSTVYLPALKGWYVHVVEEGNASWNLVASPLSLAKVNDREPFPKCPLGVQGVRGSAGRGNRAARPDKRNAAAMGLCQLVAGRHVRACLVALYTPQHHLNSSP